MAPRRELSSTFTINRGRARAFSLDPDAVFRRLIPAPMELAQWTFPQASAFFATKPRINLLGYPNFRSRGKMKHRQVSLPSYHKLTSTKPTFQQPAISGIKLLLLCVALGSLLISPAARASDSPETQKIHPTAKIIEPINGAQVTKLPVCVDIVFHDGASLANVTITLDGNDITDSFTPTRDGARALLSSGKAYIGANRLKVKVGQEESKVTFTYHPDLLGSAAPTPPLPDVIPIQTRVRMAGATGQQGWGIQVGNNAYAEPNGFTNGFQVLLLNRLSLQQVSNQSFQLLSEFDVENFINAIVPSAGKVQQCTASGCLEIIQSLDTIGYNPCAAFTQLCPVYTAAFTSIGGTQTIASTNLENPNLAYSFIGNVGSDTQSAGSSFERITCQTTGCVTFPTPDAQSVLAGIAPNGTDAMPTLDHTGSPGTTQLPATPYIPSLQISNNGAIRGSLVLDNYQTYTFAYSDPPAHFSMIAADGGLKNLFTLSGRGSVPNLQEESATLPANANGAPVGGFHLVVLNATTLQVVENRTYTVNKATCPSVPNQNYCTGPDGTEIYNLSQLHTDLTRSLNSRAWLFFLSSIGNLNHNYQYGSFYLAYPFYASYPYYGQDVWNWNAQAIQDIGGTYATFTALNNPAFLQNPYDQWTPLSQPVDDYALVGQWWINASGVPNPYALEESSQISRQTFSSPLPSNMSGMLKKEEDGYYRGTFDSNYRGLVTQASMDVSTAALMPPTPWPISLTTSTGGILSAYIWISQQLLGCYSSACDDIHYAYSNSNQSISSWETTLSNLKPPMDGEGPFSVADFQKVSAQLFTEFRYLAPIHKYQYNLLTLDALKQSNISLLLSGVSNNVAGSIPVTTRSGSQSYGITDWRTDVKDGVNVLGAVASLDPDTPGAGVVAALVQFGIDASAQHTVDPKGRTLTELTHVLYTSGQLASAKANQLMNILTTQGNDFTRIYNDWGRLHLVGSILASNQLPWTSEVDPDTVDAFDISTAREFYRTILPSAFQVNQYRYASPGLHNANGLAPNSENCRYYDFMLYQNQNPSSPTSQQTSYSYALLPGAPVNGLNNTFFQQLAGPSSSAYGLGYSNVNDYNQWWDVWTITWQYYGNGQGCTDTNHMPERQFFTGSGLFDPIEAGSTTRLGLYKPWILQRTGIPTYQIETPSDGGGFWGSRVGLPQNVAYPDPINY